MVSSFKKINILVLILFCSLLLFVPFKVYGAINGQASFNILPPAKSYIVGQIFPINLYVSTSLPINAVEATLVYPTDKLEPVLISKNKSIVGFWVNEPVISANSGNVYIAGLILDPSYKERGGKVLSINFRVKALGDASIFISNGSVLADDGFGTQILSNIFGGRYKLEPKIHLPEPVPDLKLIQTTTPEILNPVNTAQNQCCVSTNSQLWESLPPRLRNVNLILNLIRTILLSIIALILYFKLKKW